jgi:hypothetical protein
MASISRYILIVSWCIPDLCPGQTAFITETLNAGIFRIRSEAFVSQHWTTFCLVSIQPSGKVARALQLLQFNLLLLNYEKGLQHHIVNSLAIIWQNCELNYRNVYLKLEKKLWKQSHNNLH